MSFKDYTSLNKVKEHFPYLIISREIFIPTEINQFEIEPYLKKQINLGIKSYKSNEAFADKFLIAPVLNCVWLKHEKLNIWTETYIKADENLQGRPDYMVSPLDKNQYEILSLPIVVLVKAKQENFTAGWGQCLAEMLACQKLNKYVDIIIYGIVATGQVWEFGKLEKNVFIREQVSYSISNTQQTMNIINYIFDKAESEIPQIDLSVVMPDIEQNNDDRTSA
jgi:hypothetical protein